MTFSGRLPAELLEYQITHISRVSNTGTAPASAPGGRTNAASHHNWPHQKTTCQLCQDQEVDLAATTLINLSRALWQGGEERRETDIGEQIHRG